MQVLGQSTADPLRATSTITLAGLISQLGELSDYAANLFRGEFEVALWSPDFVLRFHVRFLNVLDQALICVIDLNETVKSTNQRLESTSQRILRAEDAIPAVQDKCNVSLSEFQWNERNITYSTMKTDLCCSSTMDGIASARCDVVREDHQQ